MERNILPLGFLSAGEKAEVVEVFSCRRRCRAGCKEKGQADARIEDIGIRSGKIIEMLNNEGRGPLLIKVDESRIAIGRGMAMKIMVRRLT